MIHSRGKHHHSLTGGAGPYLMLGWQIALSFFVYAAIGYFLDHWLNTTPWLLITGVVMGLIAVFARIYRVSIETNKGAQHTKVDNPNGESGSAGTNR